MSGEHILIFLNVLLYFVQFFFLIFGGQTNTQTYIKTDGHTDRETFRQTYIHTDRHKDRQIYRQTDQGIKAPSCQHSQTYIKTDRHTDKHTDR